MAHLRSSIEIVVRAAACLAAALPILSAGSPLGRAADMPCVDVQIGRDRAAGFECLNAEIQRSVDHERNAPPIAAPVDARSPANSVGIATEDAARQKMGDSFGRSATPQRPQRTFNSPLVP
jgi:hypothetical protein